MSVDTITVEPELAAAEVARAKGKKTKGVYACINAISKKLAEAGIGKTRTNAQQNYAFRGIDDIQNALAPLLGEEGLVILPRCLSHTATERHTRGGGIVFSVVVEAEFDFICVADGSTHTVKMYGEAMDSGDKATNKSMSAAYKYATLQAFCIPTEGDADATTHEIVNAPAEAAPLPPAGASKPWKPFPPASPKPPRPVDVDTFGPAPANTVHIVDVERRKTKNPNVIRFIITTSTGEEISTIKTEFGELAEQCKAAHIPVYLETQKTQWGLQVAELVAVPLPPEGPPEVPMDEDDAIPF